MAVCRDSIGRGCGGVGRGEGSSEITPVGLNEIGLELHLVRVARKRAPSQRQRAAGARNVLKLRRSGSEAETKYRAFVARPAAVGRAVEIAVRALHQRTIIGIRAVGAVEREQAGERPFGSHPEDRSIASPSIVGRAIEIALGALNQRIGEEAGKTVGAIKRYQDRDASLWSHTEERAQTVFAAEVCHAKEIAITAGDQD